MKKSILDGLVSPSPRPVGVGEENWPGASYLDPKNSFFRFRRRSAVLGTVATLRPNLVGGGLIMKLGREENPRWRLKVDQPERCILL